MLNISRRQGVQHIVLYCPACGHSLQSVPVKKAQEGIETDCDFCGSQGRIELTNIEEGE